ncbi:GrpB family protein [Planococcus halocryophilus]|uniref:GrpB family protein n=1 Tax=Planococcus halocryophilus TaxID=1215089 RepID=UPI003204F252
MREVIVLLYDEQWISLFVKEANKLNGILGEEIVSIHHFGSTSVPGLQAKPVIDILAIVKEITLVDTYTNKLRGLGYEGKGENEFQDAGIFKKVEMNGRIISIFINSEVLKLKDI